MINFILKCINKHNILEIGQDLENKFKHEMEIDKQRALENYKGELLAAVEDRMKLEIKDVEIRERLNCHMEMEKLQQDFELLLKEELGLKYTTCLLFLSQIFIIFTLFSLFQIRWKRKFANNTKKSYLATK